MDGQTVYNPPVPYLGFIPGGAYPGRMIRVQGSTPLHAQRFAINIQCGPNTNPRDDIALHVNIRFAERCIVRNDLQSMNWGPEVTTGGMPLNPGAAFEALILCDLSGYKIAFNGMHFCEFGHRVPYQRATHITVDGDVTLQTISFEGSTQAAQQVGYQQYGAPPPYDASYGTAPPPPYAAASQPPVYAQQSAMSYSQPMYQQQQYSYSPAVPPTSYNQSYQNPSYAQSYQKSSGLGTAAKVGLGGTALVGAGLAGYAIAGGFHGDSEDSSHHTEIVEADTDDWLE